MPETATTTYGAKYVLPPLPYAYNALEPIISEAIMRLHHSKHHQAYVDNLNAAMQKLDGALAEKDVKSQIALQSAIKFNGGGHINHSIFWTNLAPKSAGGGQPPRGPLADAINKEFGSLDKFIAEFNAQAAAVQGSGWGWLGYNRAAKRLEITTTQNQDPLTHLIPLLGIDVWEHAYYLDYKNARPEYLKKIWEVVNWNNVAERFEQAQ